MRRSEARHPGRVAKCSHWRLRYRARGVHIGCHGRNIGVAERSPSGSTAFNGSLLRVLQGLPSTVGLS
jgi:hypothetical protein